MSLSQTAAGTLDLGENSKPWRDIWSAGQVIGAIPDFSSVGELHARLNAEYKVAVEFR